VTGIVISRRAERRVRQPDRAGRTVSPERTAGALLISRRLLRRIETHARQAYPEECCGILVGVRRGDGVVVASSHPAANRSEDGKCDRYEIDPAEILRVSRASQDEGREIVGFHHSHPDHPSAPSVADAARAWAGYVYVITAVAACGHVETRAWVYDEPAERFRELALRIRSAERHAARRER